MLSDELVPESKSISHNLRVSGGAISQETAIAVGKGGLA